MASWARWPVVTVPPLRTALPAVRDSVPLLRTAVADHLERAGLDEDLVASVKTAVSEAVANAVLHAYDDDEPPGEVHVTAEVHADAVRVTVVDDGHGMRPRVHSPGAGLGLSIISALASSVEIGHGGRGGTRLAMTFARVA